MKTFIIILSLGLGNFAFGETTVQINLPGISYGTPSNSTVIWVGNPERTPANQFYVPPTAQVPPVQDKPVPYNPQDYWQQPGSSREFWGR